RAAKSQHMPVVDDSVVFARQQEDPVLAGLRLASHDTAQHVPRARIDAARKGPTTAQAITAGDASRNSGGKHHRRGDQAVARRAAPPCDAHATGPHRARVPAPQGWLRLRRAMAAQAAAASCAGEISDAGKLSSMVTPLGSLMNTWCNPSEGTVRSKKPTLPRRHRSSITARPVTASAI